MMRVILSILFIFVAGVSVAQSKKGKKAADEGNSVSQPTSLAPSSVVEKRAPKQSRKKSKGPTYNGEKDFAKRIEARAKENRKDEKQLEKPQYSNPLYFGHKHPPKKHAPNKMKYCKECGIRH